MIKYLADVEVRDGDRPVIASVVPTSFLKEL